MSLALIAMSHSPLLHQADVQPSAEVQAGLKQSFDAVRAFAAAVDPDLLVVFGPDHYNGFFYDYMPPYAVGTAAVGVGDYDTLAGDLSVDEAAALDLIAYLHAHDIPVTLSRRMEVDHGVVQPLEEIYGSLTAKPMVPIFVNGVAQPFTPMKSIREMGQAVGQYLQTLDKRVLMLASGGLSHDPPVPRWDTTAGDPDTRHFLLEGRHPTPEFRAARQRRVIDEGAKLAAGKSNILPLAPAWDKQFMADCAAPDACARFDAYTVDQMTKDAGHSVHEVRTWVGGFSALSAAGPYEVDYQWYQAIPEYIAGFGFMTATTA